MRWSRFSGLLFALKNGAKRPGCRPRPDCAFTGHPAFGFGLRLGQHTERIHRASNANQLARSAHVQAAFHSLLTQKQAIGKAGRVQPSLKPNRFFGGLLIRSGWRKEPRCCSHFSAGLRSVFAAAAPRKSPFFCSFFDSAQARQTVRWSRFRGLGFAPENEAEWGWLVNPFFARGRNRAASVPLNRIARP